MYTCVADKLAWPSMSLMANRFAPLFSMWVANEWRNTWGEVLDECENSFRYLFTKRYTKIGYRGSPFLRQNRGCFPLCDGLVFKYACNASVVSGCKGMSRSLFLFPNTFMEFR